MSKPIGYEITVQGHLGNQWSAWFDGFDVITRTDGTTVLRGFVTDQSALHGLLTKVRDLGLTLIAVTRVSHRHIDQPERP